MPIPDRAEKILLEIEDYITDGRVDPYKIAATSSETILSINGIGPGFLKKIAEWLEEEDLIGEDNWLDGEIISLDGIREIVEVEEWEDESDEVEPERTDSDKEVRVSFEDIQKSLADIIGPHSLPMHIIEWIAFEASIKEKIIAKIEELGLMDRYHISEKLRTEFATTADPKRKQILQDLMTFNRYAAIKESGRAFYQTHWLANIVYWLYLDSKGEEPNTALISNIDSNIKRVLNNLRRLGYAFDSREDFIPIR